MSSSANHKRKAGDMEDKDINGVGPLRYMRDVPPAHYTFKIESYSLLSNTLVEKYESREFESGGYKWRLCIYPNGDKTRNGDGHISLYLSILDSDTFPVGWEVFVNYKLFVFNQTQDKYLTIQDDYGGIRRFHRLKTVWGFAQLLSLNTLNNASNGYLVNDSCIFGAEVFVIKCSGKWECLSIVKEPVNNTFTWKIEKFSALLNKFYNSEAFTVGERKWRLSLYPKGYSSTKGKGLSLYLQLDDYKSLQPKQKVFAEYKMLIKDQVSANHCERQVKHWFDASSNSMGYLNFISLTNISRFLKNDTLVVEAQFMAMSVVAKDIS